MQVTSLPKTVVCSIRQAMEECTFKYRTSKKVKKERTYKDVNHKTKQVGTKISVDI